MVAVADINDNYCSILKSITSSSHFCSLHIGHFSDTSKKAIAISCWKDRVEWKWEITEKIRFLVITLGALPQIPLRLHLDIRIGYVTELYQARKYVN